MNTKLDRINMRIKQTWRIMIQLALIFVVFFVLAYHFHNVRVMRYQEEYESTTWREAEATLDHTVYHSERRDTDDGYEYEDYYDWYFTYEGLDGKSYTYIDKNNSYDVSKPYTKTIYVDEKDDSHSLEIRTFNHEIGPMVFVIAAVVVPFALFYGIRLLILYIRRSVEIKKQNETY